MKVSFHAVVAAMALTCLPAIAHAQLSGTLGVQLTLTTACAVTTTSATSSLNFGTVNFGTRPATFTGVLTAQPTGGLGGGGTTQVVCSPDISSMSVAVDAGSHAGEGGSVGAGARAMASGSDYVPYDLYSSSGYTTAYPTNGTPVSINVASPGTAFSLPIFGRVNKTSAAPLQPGTYTDTVQVTISW